MTRYRVHQLAATFVMLASCSGSEYTPRFRDPDARLEGGSDAAARDSALYVEAGPLAECMERQCPPGSSDCQTVFSAAGTPCGDSSGEACDGPDSCDGAGNCLDHRVALGERCLEGSGFCDSTGACLSDRNCSDIFERDLNAQTGTYLIDPDAEGPLPAMKAYCDMDTDGGGWTLVMNYLHKGGTNPELKVFAEALPLPSAGGKLGDDESGMPSWGHTNNALFAALAADEVRFFGRSGAHSRVIHFVTHDPGCIRYLSTGTGNCLGIYARHRTLPNHSANILEREVEGHSDRADLAMTQFPFYRAALHHWGIRGGGMRWEVDDYPNDASRNTIHRAWVRTR